MNSSQESKQYNQVDIPFYRREIAPFLPETILDFHAHVWSCADWRIKPWESQKSGGRYMVTDEEYPADRLQADTAKIFPDNKYRAVCFGYPVPVADNKRDTEYVARAGKRRGMYPLMITGAELKVPREMLEKRIRDANFLGYKVFLNWLGNDYGNKRIEEMLSPNEMNLANELKLVVLLHVPRSGRLVDPEIQRGVEWLSKTYPDAAIVLAHCGRCYLVEEIRVAIEAVKNLDNVFLDASMVMDPMVFQIILEAIGPSRLLFATDFPVANMRGRRVRVLDHWVDIVLDAYPDSDYRVKTDKIRATFMALEIAFAIRQAIQRLGMGRDELNAIFYNNGIRLLRNVMEGRHSDCLPNADDSCPAHDPIRIQRHTRQTPARWRCCRSRRA